MAQRVSLTEDTLQQILVVHGSELYHDEPQHTVQARGHADRHQPPLPSTPTTSTRTPPRLRRARIRTRTARTPPSSATPCARTGPTSTRTSCTLRSTAEIRFDKCDGSTFEAEANGKHRVTDDAMTQEAQKRHAWYLQDEIHSAVHENELKENPSFCSSERKGALQSNDARATDKTMVEPRSSTSARGSSGPRTRRRRLPQTRRSRATSTTSTASPPSSRTSRTRATHLAFPNDYGSTSWRWRRTTARAARPRPQTPSESAKCGSAGPTPTDGAKRKELQCVSTAATLWKKEQNVGCQDLHCQDRI